VAKVFWQPFSPTTGSVLHNPRIWVAKEGSCGGWEGTAPGRLWVFVTLGGD